MSTAVGVRIVCPEWCQSHDVYDDDPVLVMHTANMTGGLFVALLTTADGSYGDGIGYPAISLPDSDRSMTVRETLNLIRQLVDAVAAITPEVVR